MRGADKTSSLRRNLITLLVKKRIPVLTMPYLVEAIQNQSVVTKVGHNHHTTIYRDEVEKQLSFTYSLLFFPTAWDICTSDL